MIKKEYAESAEKKQGFIALPQDIRPSVVNNVQIGIMIKIQRLVKHLLKIIKRYTAEEKNMK